MKWRGTWDEFRYAEIMLTRHGGNQTYRMKERQNID